jgi:hypothetical protein
MLSLVVAALFVAEGREELELWLQPAKNSPAIAEIKTNTLMAAI